MADLGTDHALLPVHAVLRGICERAYGIDLREEPLRGAARTLIEFGVEDRVTLVLGDGLSALEGLPVDAAVIAGLSGRTMLSWFRAFPEVVSRVPRLIVQPNGHLPALRAWAHAEGLWLLDENVCREGKRYFTSCSFGTGVGEDPAYAGLGLSLVEAFELGPWLVRRRDGLAAEAYREECQRLGALVARGREEYRVALAIYETGVARSARGAGE